MKESTGRIRTEDAVIVHDYLVTNTGDGWWAMRAGRILYAATSDELLLQVADVAGVSADLEDLRGRLARSIERSAQDRADDALLEGMMRRG